MKLGLDSACEHYQDAVGQSECFVQFGGNRQDAGSFSAPTSTPRVGWAVINTCGAAGTLETHYDICLKISIIQ
jgi:hypothetical protein